MPEGRGDVGDTWVTRAVSGLVPGRVRAPGSHVRC